MTLKTLKTIVTDCIPQSPRLHDKVKMWGERPHPIFPNGSRFLAVPGSGLRPERGRMGAARSVDENRFGNHGLTIHPCSKPIVDHGFPTFAVIGGRRIAHAMIGILEHHKSLGRRDLLEQGMGMRDR